MNIVDSSAWLEFFSGTTQGQNFQPAIINPKKLLVPTIIIYEVYKKILHEFDQKTAIDFTAQLQQGKVVDLEISISILAAQLSKQYKLPMADSIILATAQKFDATIWTQDADFKGLSNVRYFPKK